jgi:hypothetical protein
VQDDLEMKFHKVCKGFGALEAIDAHAGAYYRGVNVHPGHKGFCPTCLRYASALIAGHTHDEAAHLLCEDMQAWIKCVQDARDIIVQEGKDL